jgi:hypothetical protein
LRYSQRWQWSTLLSGMWRCVGLVRTDVSRERVVSIFRAEKREWRKALAVSQLLFFARGFFLPWRWRRHVPLKRRFL